MALPLTVTNGGCAGVAAASAGLSVAAGLEQATSARTIPMARKRMTFICCLKELWGSIYVGRSNIPRIDRQRVDVAAHQFSGGSIDHPMALHLRPPGERGRGDGHVEMAALTRAGMPDVSGAVVADLEQDRLQGLQGGPQPLDALRGHEALSLPNRPRSVHNTTASVNTMATGGAIQTLNSTQSASLRFSATQMFTSPSAT